MKQSKRFKRAMHDIRLRKCANTLANAFAKLEHDQMQKPGRTRKLMESLIEEGLATAEENKTPEQKQLDKDYADSVERRKKIREGLFNVDKDMLNRPNPIREQWEKHGDLDANRPGTDGDLEQLFNSQTSDEASAFRQALLSTKHLGLNSQGEWHSEREAPDRATGESEANRDVRRIDPTISTEE